MQLLPILSGLLFLSSSSVNCSLSSGESRIFHTLEKINPSDIQLQLSLTDANLVQIASERLGTQSVVGRNHLGQLVTLHNDQRSGLFCLDLDQDGKLSYIEYIAGGPSPSSGHGCPLLLILHPKSPTVGSAYEWLINTNFFTTGQPLTHWVLARGDSDDFAVVTLQYQPPVVYSDPSRRSSWSFRKRKGATSSSHRSGKLEAKL